MWKRIDLAKYKKAIYFILITALFLCCLYALHDMQTAQGIGLFFAMQLGMDNRMPMDVTVDALGVVALALLIYLPCVKLRHKSVAAFCRLFIVYIAVVPQLDLAGVLALVQRFEPIFIWEMGFADGLWQWFYGAINFLQVWVPVFVVLVALAKRNDCFVFEKWYQMFWAVQGILLLLLLCMPAAENVVLYLVGYLGTLVAFDCWERVLGKNEKLTVWISIPFLLLLLKGIYRVLVLVSTL